MNPLKLIFMGTPEFALPTLAALVEAGHTIAAVYTAPPRPAGRGQKQTPSPVHRFALEHGLNVLTPSTLRDAALQEQFAHYHADAAIVAAYGLLLPGPILTGARLGCLNVHPSLLPRWRGAAPIQRAIMAGDTEAGVVIMQMNAGLDTGDMLLVKQFPLPSDMTAGMLHDTLAERAAPMVLGALEGLENGTITPAKQPEEGITYAKKITKEDCRIDWKNTAHAIRNQIRGLSPSPGAYFLYRNEAIKVLNADACPVQKTISDFMPGAVMDNHLTVACGEGALGLMTVQRPGKKPMQASELLKGFAIPAGSQLG